MSGSEIGKVIREAREARGWNQPKLAKMLEVERATISHWENNRFLPSRKNAVKLANLLNIDVNILIGAADHANVTSAGRITAKRSVPLISWVQAGESAMAHDPYPVGIGEEIIDVAANVSDGSYALVVRGDSMEPEFCDGDIIVIDPVVEPQPGDYILAEIFEDGMDAGELTFKQFRPRGLGPDGLVFDLVPLNPIYDTITIIDGKSGRVRGRLMEFRRVYD